MSSYTYELVRAVTEEQLANVPHPFLTAAIRAENAVLERSGTAMWSTKDGVHTFRVCGPKNLVDRWAKAVDHIINFVPKARGW